MARRLCAGSRATAEAFALLAKRARLASRLGGISAVDGSRTSNLRTVSSRRIERTSDGPLTTVGPLRSWSSVDVRLLADVSSSDSSRER